MKAARIVAHRAPLVVGEIAEPDLGPGDARVRVEASGICRTDWHTWNGDFGWIGFQVPLPIVPGHEFGGTVVEVGGEVARLRVGDRVTVPFVEGCGYCESCAAGRSGICWNLNAPGFTHDGGYAERVRVPNADLNCVKLPDEVDMLAAAALGCRYSTAYQAVVHRGRLNPGEWVSVFGAGGMGLSAVQIASRLGGRVIAIDVRAEALAAAKQHGATATIDVKAAADVAAAVREISGGGAHLSIDCWSRDGATLQSILGLRRGGRHVQAAFTSQAEQGMIAVPADVMCVTEIEFLGCAVTSHARYPELLNLLVSGHLAPEALVTKRIALEEASESMFALDRLETVGMHVITAF